MCSRRSTRRSRSARAAGVHVQVVHMKLSGLDNWGRAAETARRASRRARERGVAIDCDQYPYTAASNPLKNLLPPLGAVGQARRDDGAARRSRGTRARIRSEIAATGLNNFGRIPDWDAIRISVSPHQAQFAGRTIAEIARERRRDDDRLRLRLSHRRPLRDARARHLDRRGGYAHA